MRSRLLLGTAALTLAAAGAVATSAPANAAGHKPDTSCMKAGIKTLQGAGLLPAVARNGVSIQAAVGLGVTVRPGADISGVPDPIPFPLLLADHRAGSNSLFVYPWC